VSWPTATVVIAGFAAAAVVVVALLRLVEHELGRRVTSKKNHKELIQEALSAVKADLRKDNDRVGTEPQQPEK
jgi:hypothetical protein